MRSFLRNIQAFPRDHWQLCQLGIDCASVMPVSLLEVVKKSKSPSAGSGIISGKSKEKTVLEAHFRFPALLRGFLEYANTLIKEVGIACQFTNLDNLALNFGNGQSLCGPDKHVIWERGTRRVVGGARNPVSLGLGAL